ncbi:CRE-BATH-38 protein, partial [Aphelenchoides avenae]
GAHKGTLILTIGDWDAFKQKPEAEKVYGEPQILGGIRFTLEAFIKGPSLGILVRAAHPTQHPEWHCKAEYYLRWPRSPRAESKNFGALLIFDNTKPLGGWLAIRSLDAISRFYVVNNALTLKMDITTFDCQVTDGRLGHKLRCHDVTFVFGTRRIYCNKGFLAMHSQFFEGMFFGDFADRNKEEVELPTVTVGEFETFLEAIAPVPQPHKPRNVLRRLRMADRFQAHKLAESCVEYLISDKEVPFVKQLEVGDELNMTHFRDLLIETATNAELTEAAKTEYESVFSTQTWMKMYMKYRDL